MLVPLIPRLFPKRQQLFLNIRNGVFPTGVTTYSFSVNFVIVKREQTGNTSPTKMKETFTEEIKIRVPKHVKDAFQLLASKKYKKEAELAREAFAKFLLDPENVAILKELAAADVNLSDALKKKALEAFVEDAGGPPPDSEVGGHNAHKNPRSEGTLNRSKPKTALPKSKPL